MHGGRDSEQLKMQKKKYRWQFRTTLNAEKGMGVAIPNSLKFRKRQAGSDSEQIKSQKKSWGGRNSEQIKM